MKRRYKIVSIILFIIGLILIINSKISILGAVIGAYEHEFVDWVAVELQERGGKIYYHGYPTPEYEIPKDVGKKRR